MVHEYHQKIKLLFEGYKKELFTAALIFLTGMASFGLGRLSVIWPEKMPVTITNNPRVENQNNNTESTTATETVSHRAQTASAALKAQGKYVGSRSGRAYHYPWCSGARRIKEANKIWFQSKEEAEAKGYKPAGNCPGL